MNTVNIMKNRDVNGNDLDRVMIKDISIIPGMNVSSLNITDSVVTIKISEDRKPYCSLRLVCHFDFFIRGVEQHGCFVIFEKKDNVLEVKFNIDKDNNGSCYFGFYVNGIRHKIVFKIIK